MTEMEQKFKYLNARLPAAADGLANVHEKTKMLYTILPYASGEMGKLSRNTEILKRQMDRARLSVEEFNALDVNPSIADDIASAIEKLNFRKAGGTDLERTYENIIEMVNERNISEQEAIDLLKETLVAAEALKVKMGELTEWEAAENIAEELNIPLGEALELIRKVKKESQFHITSTVDVIVRQHQQGATPVLPGGPQTPPGTAVPHAYGGPVYPGQSYIVGENGPELIVPKASGTVIPNNQLGMGGQVTVNQYISNPAAAALAVAQIRAMRNGRISADMGG